MAMARIATLALAALWILAGVAFGAAHPNVSATKPIEVLQGEIAELQIPSHGLSTVAGRLGKEIIPFYRKGDAAYAAVVGIDLEAKPGTVKVIVKDITDAGAHHEIAIALRIKPKLFKKESFSVAAEFDSFTQEVLERIRKEQDEFSRVFATSAPQRLWEGAFVPPVSAEISSPFGYRRVINGTPRAPHTGTDLRVPTGTEVRASNHGKVVLLGDFFFSGRSVILDHGGGLYTMYFHLSEFCVEEGATVVKGDVIGLSGMTGRVTGPHLHWGARLNNARIDPFELVSKLSGQSEKTTGSQATLEIPEK
jgi:murein DD-endopeptidase MepM/ murein hydrolase activator NlpD